MDVDEHAWSAGVLSQDLVRGRVGVRVRFRVTGRVGVGLG